MNIPISGNNDNLESVPVRILTGQKELKELSASVISALCDADLIEEVRAFHDRVITPSLSNHRKMLDYDQVGENVFVCKFQPMVELVLLEMRAAATAQGWTDKMRKDRIAEVLSIAGF